LAPPAGPGHPLPAGEGNERPRKLPGPRRRPMTLAEAGPGTENERLGRVRLSMLRNPLIIKVRLGCRALLGAASHSWSRAQRREGERG
uniref:Uncharacterized protein n=1 Tax=Geospiza parvula TaxID=87175 RepID=A0A8C3MV11_GEOPR